MDYTIDETGSKNVTFGLAQTDKHIHAGPEGDTQFGKLKECQPLKETL